MNKVILMGRLTRTPEIRYTQSEKATAVARYTLAVNRTYKREGEPEADFINCVAFGRTAENAGKYLRKGSRVIISGRIQTGSYMKDDAKVYTTDIIVEEQFFAESKAASESRDKTEDAAEAPGMDGFMNLPEGIDMELPFG